jgi:hypothetical protein
VYKLYVKIISRKISVISEPNEKENGFKRGRSFMDSIFTIQQLLERHTNTYTENLM